MGSRRGLERANKVIVPVLFILFLVLVWRAVTLPGSEQGLRYIFVPTWSKLLEPMTWGMALGQAFFTVSLNGAGMVVFGSYLRPDADIPTSALQTVTFDTMAALLAALIIMPAVFAYGLDPAQGPPLLFVTLPELFRAMPAGQWVGLLFFTSVLLAALSSLLAMMEVVVEGLMDQLGWRRMTAVLVASSTSFVGALPLALDITRFTRFVDLITIYVAPPGAVVAAVLFFWGFGVDEARREINVGSKRPVGRWWNPIAKHVFVLIALVIVGLQILYQVG